MSFLFTYTVHSENEAKVLLTLLYLYNQHLFHNINEKICCFKLCLVNILEIDFVVIKLFCKMLKDRFAMVKELKHGLMNYK